MTDGSRKPLWPWAIIGCVIIFVAGSAAVAAVYMAVEGCVLTASLAAGLSVAWLGIGVALVGIRFGARRVQAETTDYVVKQVLARLESASNAESATEKAEAIDRLNGLASKALEYASRGR